MQRSSRGQMFKRAQYQVHESLHVCGADIWAHKVPEK